MSIWVARLFMVALALNVVTGTDDTWPWYVGVPVILLAAAVGTIIGHHLRGRAS